MCVCIMLNPWMSDSQQSMFHLLNYLQYFPFMSQYQAVNEDAACTLDYLKTGTFCTTWNQACAFPPAHPL